jgi:cysteine-S-conjugate beta-lyase
MMDPTTYDFDQPIERRGTGSTKWDMTGIRFGDPDLLAMWIADMDLPCPRPVVQAIAERARHPIFGYTEPGRSLYEAIASRLESVYGWRVEKEWIVMTAGVVDSLQMTLRAIAHPGDEVIVQPPVYYPFFSVIRNSGCSILYNQLLLREGRYVMDLEGLRGLFGVQATFPVRVPRIRALILCSPHNPIGRVWTRDELGALGEICIEHGCVLLSDEVHCDLTLGGPAHTVTATVSPQLQDHTITFMSASKTFNLAGLDTSFAVIPNERLRRRFLARRAGHSRGNVFGYVALEAAFRHGDGYLEQLRRHLAANFEEFGRELHRRVPGCRMLAPQATYLAWVDMRTLGLSPLGLQAFLRKKARLAVDDGFAFGPGGEGFARFNLACPRATVVEAVNRVELAVRDFARE